MTLTIRASLVPIYLESMSAFRTTKVTAEHVALLDDRYLTPFYLRGLPTQYIQTINRLTFLRREFHRVHGRGDVVVDAPAYVVRFNGQITGWIQQDGSAVVPFLPDDTPRLTVERHQTMLIDAWHDHEVHRFPQQPRSLHWYFDRMALTKRPVNQGVRA